MPNETTRRARELRQRQTKAEALLWSSLRAKQLCGLKFRRQHPVGPFIADFACVNRHLIVEVDGGYHDYQYAEDISRQKYLEDHGWLVIRFSNQDVLEDVDAIASSIARQVGLEPEFAKRKLARSSRRPSPGPSGPTLYVQFQSYRKAPNHGRLVACGVARNHGPGLWLDHLGEIFSSDLRCEELVHHAARPLITRIA